MKPFICDEYYNSVSDLTKVSFVPYYSLSTAKTYLYSMNNTTLDVITTQHWYFNIDVFYKEPMLLHSAMDVGLLFPVYILHFILQ